MKKTEKIDIKKRLDYIDIFRALGIISFSKCIEKLLKNYFLGGQFNISKLAKVNRKKLYRLCLSESDCDFGHYRSTKGYIWGS